jgi:flagellar motility protein MotE (MotC chaperone)
MRNKITLRKPSWLGLEMAIILGLIFKMALAGSLLVSFSKGTGIIGSQKAMAANPAQAQTTDSTKPTLPLPKDPALMERYRAMLMVLEGKEINLKEKEQRLKEEEEALHVLKDELKIRLAEVNNKLTELTEQKKFLTGLIAEYKQLIEQQKTLEDARITHLVKAYSGMRAENAANLVNSLDDYVAVRILSAMSGRAAGQIMSFVRPTKAARLTKMLSEFNQPRKKGAEKTGGKKK